MIVSCELAQQQLLLINFFNSNSFLIFFFKNHTDLYNVYFCTLPADNVSNNILQVQKNLLDEIRDVTFSFTNFLFGNDKYTNFLFRYLRFWATSIHTRVRKRHKVRRNIRVFKPHRKNIVLKKPQLMISVVFNLFHYFWKVFS